MEKSVRYGTPSRSDWREYAISAVVSGIVLVITLAGFVTWLHPELFDPALPIPTIVTLVVIYPTVVISLLLWAGPRTFRNARRLTRCIGFAGMLSGAFCLLVFSMSSRQFPLLIGAMLLQMAVPWILPRFDTRALALLSIVVRGGTVALLVFWLIASAIFAAHINAVAASMADGRQHCLSAPAWHDLFGSTALSSGSDLLLLQRMIAYPVNLYYGRHRLELTIFESSDRFETFHWSIRSQRFEPGGFLTPIEACRAVLRGAAA
jgi:hypothetical protein